MPVAGRYAGQEQIGAVSSVLSTKRTKNNRAVRQCSSTYGSKGIILFMYVLQKKNDNTRQQYGSAAVRTVAKDRGVQQWGRWYSQAPSGRPVLL